jgi:hypothetical protein
MGQEVNANLNNRRILNVGGYLNELLLFADKWKGVLNDYHLECSLTIETYLSIVFLTNYKHRGMTALTNHDIVNLQSLYLDSKPDCTCDEIIKNI